ncbi:MAG: hypothetical protein IJ074_12285 [Clostridia bacterium]|nr:hypothetical protein [Clostridia bacterium]
MTHIQAEQLKGIEVQLNAIQAQLEHLRKEIEDVDVLGQIEYSIDLLSDARDALSDIA